MKNFSPQQILITRACFRQLVTLKAQQVHALSDDELQEALLFEVEPFSGIARTEGKLAWRAVPSSDPTLRTYLVIQIRSSDLHRLRLENKRNRTLRAVSAPPDEAHGENVRDLPIIPFSADAPIRSMSLFLSIIGLSLLGLFLIGTTLFQMHQIRSLSRTRATRQVLQNELDHLTRAEQEALAQRQALEQARTHAKTVQQNAARAREAWLGLFDALAPLSSSSMRGACALLNGKIWLSSITPHGPTCVALTGGALSSDELLRNHLLSPQNGWRESEPLEITPTTTPPTVQWHTTWIFDPLEKKP